MRIESKQVAVNAQAEQIFDFVSDLRNFEVLLPQDKISEWESTEDACSFKISGGYTIGLEKLSLTRASEIILKSSEKSPIDFTLNIHMKAQGDGTLAYQIIEAKVNPFVKMMIEKPLTNLFDYIADKLQEKFA